MASSKYSNGTITSMPAAAATRSIVSRLVGSSQVTDVLKQETQERIALADAPAVTRAGLADGSFHDIAARKSTAG
jgi:hypothetical protein